MNIFKRLFNWVQSAPADFCYVTGEWGFQRKASARPVLPSNAFQGANDRRSPVVLPAAPVAAFAALPVAPVDHDAAMTNLLIHSATTDVQNQNTYPLNVGI